MRTSRPKRHPDTVTSVVAGILTVILGVVVGFVPIDYVVWRNGPGINLLGNDAVGQPLIKATGISTYRSSGSVILPSISETPPDGSVSLIQAVAAFFIPGQRVYPAEFSYPIGGGEDTVAQETGEFQDAEFNAEVAALIQAGQQVSRVPRVTVVVRTSPAFGKLQVDDYILSVNGQPTTSAEMVDAQIRQMNIGTHVSFEIARGDTNMTETIETTASYGEQLDSRVGVQVVDSYQFDPDISFNLDPQLRRPDGGLAMGLALYELFSQETLVPGDVVSAAGVLAPDGTVSAVTGAPALVLSAKKAGASVFLMPRANCADISMLDPEMRVVPVDSLAQAVEALRLLIDDPHSDAVAKCSVDG
jgi:PDZ domain-containing protein